MKKIFTLAAVLFVGIALNEAKAQNTATLNVNISATRSVIVSAGTGTVNWTFNTPAQFTSGENKSVDNHLTVVSTTGYIVKVASTTLTGGTGGAIPVNAIQIKADAGTVNVPTESPVYAAQADLALTATDLITATGGTPISKFKVDYFAKGGADFLGRTGLFTGTVTYTIIAN